MRLSVDTGGTFTDLVVEDADGGVTLHKRPTTPHEPVLGILDVLQAAAAERGLSRAELLGSADSLIHATTHSLNALLTDETARTALLATRGHPDVILLREGGREHFNARGRYPAPSVPRSLTYEIGGRILVSGAELEAFGHEDAEAAAADMRDREVEAVAVCFLWSIANPAHELAAAEVLERHLPGVPYTLSHRLSPSLREYRRASAAVIDASLKPLMQRYLSRLSDSLRDEGFGGRLLMVTSAGALLDVEDVAEAPVHSIKSGPSMAPVAGRAYALEGGASTAVVTDTGGTSYDVSAVLSGRIPWTRETWLGRPYHSHLTGFPSVDVRSYGAGGGSIAWVDAGGLLHVGPQSAGADPGPVAYGRGASEPTFTDAAVTLGWIHPSDFLGGSLLLDAAAARRALEERVGQPLGLDADAAAAAVVELATEGMARAIEETVLRHGIDPARAVLVAGGGAAGLNAVGVARRIGIPTVVIPSVSAALSAAGALLGDVGRDFATSHPVRASRFDFDGVDSVLDGLVREAERFLARVGDEGWERRIDLFVEGHYARQVWEIEVALPARPGSSAEVAKLVEAFHRRHEELYAVRDDRSDVEFLSWRARAWARRPRAEQHAAAGGGAEGAAAREAEARFPGHGWVRTRVAALGELVEGTTLAGPCLVTSPVTTAVIDPGARARVTPSGSLAIDVEA